MKAKDYLLKAAKICDEYDNKAGCNKCPLKAFACGCPKEEKEITAVVELVETYDEKTFPFGKCSSCEKEFNSELRSEYQINYCPWCGEVIAT